MLTLTRSPRRADRGRCARSVVMPRIARTPCATKLELAIRRYDVPGHLDEALDRMIDRVIAEARARDRSARACADERRWTPGRCASGERGDCAPTAEGPMPRAGTAINR